MKNRKKSTSRSPSPPHSRETVLITGGARGLGLAMASVYAARGATVLLCSRTKEDLVDAERIIGKRIAGARVEWFVCDISDREQVESMFAAIHRRHDFIDTVVNNAGIILASPNDEVSIEDLRNAMDSNLWGMIHVTYAALPEFRRRKKGRFLNITSVGGLVPVPHLLTYGTSKFGAVGFSTTLGLSLRRSGISVTTAAPFLMRTGSFLHAQFKGSREKELTWFAKSSSIPGITVDAEKAARKLIRACDRRQSFVTIGWPTRIAQIGFALAPRFVLRAMSLADRLLPRSPGDQRRTPPEKGRDIESRTKKRPQTRLGDRAASRLNEARDLH